MPGRIRHILLLLAIASTIVSVHAQPAANRPLGAIPADGLPLAQIFDGGVPDPSVYLQHRNKVYFIWGSGHPKQPGNIVASRYFPSVRNPDRKRDIEWYKKNHPDWILYQADQTTPAYGYIYDFGGLVPLDVSNPAVRQYYLSEFILPAVQKGYRVVAMDNVDLGNWPGAAGRFVNGKWEQLYTGKKNDTAFQQSMISWIQFLADQLHPLGVAVAANIKASSAPMDVVLRMMQGADIWLDENGFTHTGKNITGKAWEWQRTILERIVPSKGYISINQIRGTMDQADPAQIEWVIANFLLLRGPQSLLAVTGFEKKAIYQEFHYRPELDISIGAPVEQAHPVQQVWTRRYQNGIVYVNPSPQDTARIAVPGGHWKTLNGSLKQKTLQLQPGSGMILIKE
ncbi:putative glycoside hydrolase family 15 protein [Niabella pedocola]|uniref:Glycoside hydrolase family 15 protein n=1 Tax=Niabella pedocola TaxID=1752077 RepID=A0ABS8PWQ5_9BACT|nr:putative glycoside hydrolase [Niabella pedocola]MCD2425254.1 putative glycoside hydrolase family 15 protein [Niabella pedocola]